jgi:hypothetical protein
MRFTTNAIVILESALCVFVGNAAAAQMPATELPLAVGTRVRVSSSAPWFSGPPSVANVLGQRGDTLSVQPEGTRDSIALPIASITQLEVSAGRSSHVGRGIGLGFLTGALAGVVIGAATYRPSSCGSSTGAFCPIDFSQGATAAAGGAVGGLLGAFVGAVIGERETENWARVAVTARKVAFRLAPSGKSGLTVSATF